MLFLQQEGVTEHFIQLVFIGIYYFTGLGLGIQREDIVCQIPCSSYSVSMSRPINRRNKIHVL